MIVQIEPNGGYLSAMPPEKGPFNFTDDVNRAMNFDEIEAQVAIERLRRKGWGDGTAKNGK